MSAAQEQMGSLSADESALMSRLTPAANLLAFLDSQQVTVGPPIRADGSGWLIVRDVDAFVVTAWGTDSAVKLERRCSTLTYAVELIRRYEHLLPL